MSKKDKNYEIYFAAKEADETVSVLFEKSKDFFKTLDTNKHIDKVNNMWRAYHGYYNASGNDHEISFNGEEEELVELPVNHLRNIAQHMHRIITSNRPTMEARAINTDYKSMSQTYLANGILEYYMREKGLEKCLIKAVEMAIVLGVGYVKMDWNATAGEAYDVDPETGEFNYEGELEFSNPSFYDVVVDGTKETWNNEWVLVRSYINKYNLIAKYPELEDEIMAVETKDVELNRSFTIWSNDSTDDIPIYEFFHKKTEALPDGRYIQFVSPEVVLLDTDMPYRQIPVFRIVPSEIMGTPYGYSPMFDVYPIQEAINSLYSTIITNESAFGVQNVFVKRGADLNIMSLEGGMNIIEGNDAPQPLNLTQTPPEIFRTLEQMIAAAETISGISSVTRGNPEASLQSGAALALVQSMSLQFLSGLQQQYVKLIEDTGTAVINILKDYANTPKLIALVGKNNKSLLKEFTGDMISSINRVVVDMGNALSNSTAGRVQMAEQLLQMKLIKDPNQYFQVLNTGRLDAGFEGEMSELLLIKQENEALMIGEEVKAAIIDKHSQHIIEHKNVMADPTLRKDQVLVANVTNHIQEHIDFLRNTDPDLLMLIGEQPLNPPAAQGNPNLPPGPQAANNQQVLEGSPNAEMIQPMSNEGELPNMPGMPEMPTPPAPFENNPVDPSQM